MKSGFFEQSLEVWHGIYCSSKTTLWGSIEGDPTSQLLEESLDSHLKSIGTSGANAVFLAAFLGSSWASRPRGDAPSLPATTYARLLRRLGHEFAENWIGLTAAGWQLPHESLATALVEELASNVQEESFHPLVAALLAIAKGDRISTASAVQKVSARLSLQVAFSLLSALLEEVCHKGDQATADWAPLAVSISSRAVQDPRASKLCRESLLKSVEKCQDHTFKAAWLQVSKVLEEATQTSGLPEDAAPEIWKVEIQSKANISEEVLLFWPDLGAIPKQLSDSDIQVEKSASKGEGALRIDLYANPAAKAAQDAVVAALPPSRRCEALLSAAKAEAIEETLPAVLGAWREEPESCAAVLLRQTSEQQASWPIPVLAPMLTALIREDAPGWKSWKTGPFDRGLLTSTWAGLCSDGEVSAGFWPWALSELVIPNLASDATRRRFAAEAARLLASTLKADLAARQIELQLDEALQERFRSRDAVLRLQSLKRVPLAALVFSLAEVVLEEPSAEDALVTWLNVAAGMKDLPAEARCRCLSSSLAGGFPYVQAPLQRHLNMQLARIMVAKESDKGYAGQLLRASLFEGGKDTSAVGLLAVCLNPQKRVTGPLDQLDLWPLLSTALRWPARRLTQLVLHVLPEIFLQIKVQTPNGYVNGKRLDCSSKKYVDFGVSSPVIRCLHCLYCCVIAESINNPVEASNFLRSICEVTRNALGILKVETLPRLCAHVAAFLHAFLDAVPSSPSSPGMRAALMLMQSLRRKLGTATPDYWSSIEDQLKAIHPP
eukprot:symbB.v1.2.006285.t1/scaffold375.1/size220138/3